MAEHSSGFKFGKGEGTRFVNNCYHGKIETMPADESPLLADPRLVDPAARGDGFQVLRNFMLTRQSPCIGAGAPMAKDILDLFGNPVPDSGPVCIGIHEVGQEKKQ
jgi:hypothetical protein